MGNNLKYSNHIDHYITDARVSDYFNPGKEEQQSIRRRYQLFESLLALKKQDRFCEIGSGGGEALNILNKSGALYFPVDLSHKNLHNIVQKSQTATLPAVSDIYTLPFKNNSFDKIIISEVLEHLEKPAEALNEVYRVLKAGGRAVVSVPNKEKISYHLCIHCNQLTPANAHLHSFDKNSLTRMAESSGFSKHKILTFGNKLGQLIQVNQPLRIFPYLIWRITDMLLSMFVPKKSHLLIVLSKD